MRRQFLRGPGLIRLVLQFAVSLALLTLLWRLVGGAEAARRLSTASPGWLLCAVAALTLQTYLSALRWQLTARQVGIRIGTGPAIREYYLAQVVNQCLPGGVVGDAGRALRSRAQAGLVRAGQAVVFERAAGQLAMIALLGLAFVVTDALPGGLDWPPALAVPLRLLMGAGLGFLILCAMLLRLPGPAGRILSRALGPFRRSLGTGWVLLTQLVLSAGTVICNLAAFWVCLRAVGAEMSFAAVCALVPLVLMTMVIPLTISGWGMREGAAVALLPLAGVAPSDALAGSVAFGLMILASVLPGAILPLLSGQTSRPAMSARHERPRRDRKPEPPVCAAPGRDTGYVTAPGLETPPGASSLETSTGRTRR
ncbi:lysylphosphatidylglycerol synthase transmembrane domain-containing protein [Pseudooceanicola sp. C21-150M6]|uniref:lysylphosphatidylglycerol synthase transmembrane domain-containing protein n=1 Tax=Pseudooceanicola sp. C21-150M6 TaxID=3434355 RepID=UPI003D7F7FC5